MVLALYPLAAPVARNNMQRDLSCDEEPASPVLVALIKKPLGNRAAISK